MRNPFPASAWLRGYDRSWLRGDVIAGLTLAAYLLPAGLGDASLANLPPEAGLYACLFGRLVLGLVCCSSPARNCPNCSAFTARMEISGKTPGTFSGT